MRLRLLGSVVALAVLGLASANEARAQAGVGSDPFSFYYGYYLPHQAAQAAQPKAIDTINQIVATRQYTAQTDRAQLYDPISPYGAEEDDPLRPYSSTGRPGSGGKATSYGYGGSNSAINGNGPNLYYNRTARYFPAMKPGRGPNRNLAALKGSRNMGGGGGMPSMPSMGGMGGGFQ
jgi:hypothetical protein